MKTTLWLIVATLLLSGCSAWSKVNTTVLNLGMTKTEVTTALKKKPDNTVAARYNDLGQKVELVSYSNEATDDRYLLTFVDDKLTEWHHAPLPAPKATVPAGQSVR